MILSLRMCLKMTIGHSLLRAGDQAQQEAGSVEHGLHIVFHKKSLGRPEKQRPGSKGQLMFCRIIYSFPVTMVE